MWRPLLAAALLAVPVLTPTTASSPLAQVTIYQDAYGVSHIFAPDVDSLAYANGYVQAWDRLWAMELLRHLGYGEGASLVGASVLELDIGTRRDLYSRSELLTILQGLPARTADGLEAYSAGVNRAAAEMQAQGELPAEFAALNDAFAPWTALDSVAVATFLLARFGTGGGSEVSNVALLDQLQSAIADPGDAEAAFADVVWGNHAAAYATTPGTYASGAQQGTPKAFVDIPAAQLEAIDAARGAEAFGLESRASDLLASPQAAGGVGRINFRWGSNALVVAPSRSEDGLAMVGGGPQMGFFTPQVPYEVGLHAPGYEAIGIGVVGAPGVVLGRTPTFAWTVTSGISDQTDTIALPASGARTYVWDDDERALQCRTEVHLVLTPPALTGLELSAYDPDENGDPFTFGARVLQRNYEPVTQEVCLADIDGTASPVVAVTTGVDGNPAWFFAQRSSSRMEEGTSADRWLHIATTTNLEEFRSTFDDFSYTFNFFYAGRDSSGDEVACHHHVGRQPVRHPDLDPRFPTPAGGEWLWQGYLQGVSGAEPQLPRSCNPPSGYLANWNNLPQAGWSAGDSRELWGSLHRVERLDLEVQQVLSEDSNGKLTLDQVKEILRRTATEDSLAHEVVPAILDLIPAGGAKDALAAWAADDYAWSAGGSVSNATGTHYDHAGHTVYDELVPALLSRVLGDEQGPHLRQVNWNPATDGDPHAADHGEHNNQFAVLVDALTGATAYDWCDDLATTTVTESCADAVATALADTGLDGFATAGDIPLTEQHFTRFTSLGVGPAYTMPMTNRATYYHFHIGSDITASVAVLPAGISGHVSVPAFLQMLGGSPEPEHLGDQLPLYVGFTFKEVPVTQDHAAALAARTIELTVPPAP